MALAMPTHAIQFIATNSYIVAEDQTIADEQWVSAGIAMTAGTFENDLLIMAGSDLLLNGSYEGNVWGIGSGSSMLSGTCWRNARLAGRTVQISGAIGGNVIALGDTVKIAPQASISGNAKLLGNNVILEGTTQGDVSITASRVATLSGTIKGNVSIIAPEIILQPNTRIGGNLTYTTGKELVPTEGIVAGTLDRSIPQATPAFSKTQLLSHAMWFLAALMAGIPFITLFPMTTAMAAQLVRTSPWKCLWVGALCALALPMFGIMCVSSVVGIPLGALMLGSWGFMVYTSRIIMGLVIGMLVLRQSSTSIGHVLLAMVTGLAVIYTATAIPAIAWSVQTIVISMGMGALLLGLFQKRRLIIEVPHELEQIEKLKQQETNNKEE